MNFVHISNEFPTCISAAKRNTDCVSKASKLIAVNEESISISIRWEGPHFPPVLVECWSSVF